MPVKLPIYVELDEEHVEFLVRFAEEHDLDLNETVETIIERFLARSLNLRTRYVLRKLELARLKAAMIEYEIVLKAYSDLINTYKMLKEDVEWLIKTLEDEKILVAFDRLMECIDAIGYLPDRVREACGDTIASIEWYLSRYYDIVFDLEEFMKEIWLNDLPPEEYLIMKQRENKPKYIQDEWEVTDLEDLGEKL